MESSSKSRSRLYAASPAPPPLTALLIVLLTIATLMPTSSSYPFIVGGKRHWSPNVNYTEWAANKRFFLGDWLVFRWEKGHHDVLQVNVTDYATCYPANPISSCTRGNRCAIQLNQTGPWYFICSHDYCSSGMKLVVNVEHLPEPPSPAPSPSPSSIAAAVSSPFAFVVAILAATTAAMLI